LLLSGGRRHTKREGKHHNGNNAPYRHGLVYYPPHLRGERTMQLWISLDSDNMHPPESLIWTSVSRIVRFFCRRHNDFAHQTSVSTNDTNDRRTLNSGHVSGTNQRRVELV
jgi:hypothetical protein